MDNGQWTMGELYHARPQGFADNVIHTQGVALGWYIAPLQGS